MATKAPAKKTSSKSTVKKSPQSTATAKRTTAKKTAAKKTSVTKSTTKSSSAKKKAPQMQSLKLAPETEDFMSTKLTIQTVYWIIISLLSLTFVLWILTLQTDINNLYDQIETLQQEKISLSERYNI